MTDQEWYDGFLAALGKCLDDGDTLSRLRLFRDAKKARPHLAICFDGLEFLLPRIDSAEAAKKASAEIIVRLKATTTNINIDVEGDLKAESGATVGVDTSMKKTSRKAGQ